MGIAPTTKDVPMSRGCNEMTRAASSVIDERARRCIEALKRLKDSEMHTTHLMNNGDEMPLKQLGINVTTDAWLPIPTSYS